jgi:hypothetical protein
VSLLPPEVVADLTGYKQPSRQMRWLTANGWRFQVGGDGLPKVDEEHYREQMGVKREKPRKGPRLEGLARGQTANQDA